MKRRFKAFLKTIGKKKYTLASITSAFNKWSTQSIKYNDVNILKRRKKPDRENSYNFGGIVHNNKACVNKHVMRKWCNEFGLEVK